MTEGVTYDNREEIAEAIASAEGLRLIHPYDDWDVIHGAGTIGLEILEDACLARSRRGADRRGWSDLRDRARDRGAIAGDGPHRCRAGGCR